MQQSTNAEAEAAAPTSQPDLVRGRVIWFGDDKGYGYIRPEGGREAEAGQKHGADDVYVHFAQIVAPGFRSLKPGDVVEFQIGPSARYQGKTEARNVVLVREAGQ